MKDRIIALAFAVFSACGLNAQEKKEYEDFNVAWGEFGKKKKANYFYELTSIADNSGSYYGVSIPVSAFLKGTNNVVVGKLGYEYRLVKVDSDLTLCSTPLPLKLDGKKTKFEFVLKLNEAFYLFTSFRNVKHKKSYLFAQELDKEKLSVSGNAEMVAEIDYSNHGRYKDTQFGYTYSPDSSLVLLTHNLINNDDIILEMGMTLIDDELNKKWHSNNITALQAGFFSVEQYEICRNGDVFLLGKQFDQKKELKKQEKKLRYTYQAILLQDNGRKSLLYPLEVPEKSVYRLTSILSKDENTFQCAGLYTAKEKFAVLGTCYFEIDKKRGKVVKQELSPYGKELITAGMTKWETEEIERSIDKNNEYEEVHYNLKKPIIDDNGGFWTIAEAKYYKAVMVTPKTYTYAPVYAHLYVNKYDGNGTVEWAAKLDKNLLVGAGENMVGSYFAHHVNSKLYLVYMSGKTNKLTGREYFVTTIDENGDLKEEIIGNKQDQKISIRSYGTGYFSKNSIFLYGANNSGTKYQFLKIDFKE